MPGQASFAFRQGNRTEYLALYLLSSLGLATKVPREEDIGIDFHCTLAERKGASLLFYSPFNVQFKSSSEQRIVYGGFDQKGSWKRHELEWLRTQVTPFFVALVDKHSGTLELFHTITRWELANNPSLPYQVALAPRSALPDGSIPNHWLSDLPKRDDLPDHIATEYEFPLGPPIVKMTAEDAENQDVLQHLRQVLDKYIQLDMENAVWAALGLSFIRFPSKSITNEGPRHVDEDMLSYNQPNSFTAKQESALIPLAKSLATTFMTNGETTKAQLLISVLESIMPADDLRRFQRNMSRICECSLSDRQ